MQVASRIHAGRTKEIARGWSELVAQTHALRLETGNLERRLREPICSALRLLLGRQRDDLLRAEAALARRTRKVLGRASRVGRPPHASPPATGHRKVQPVDERVVDLVEGHEAASRLAHRVGLTAAESEDPSMQEFLKARCDAHDEAAWTLAPWVFSSVVSCDLCAARSTCPLSAAVSVPHRCSAVDGLIRTSAERQRNKSANVLARHQEGV